MTRLRNRLVAVTLASVMALSACTTAPAGGGRILAAGTVEDDVRIGREAHPQILNQYGGAVDDPAMRAYVQALGTRLQDVSELPDIDFTFTVLDSEVVNAFALPGGYVYVSRGLMALAEDEAELAGVIGHEIGHVTARHGAARQTTGTLATVGAVGLTILGGIFGGQAGAELAGQAGQIAALGVISGYSRSQEYEADALGVRYLDRAGYDPLAMASFLEALQTSAQLQGQLAGVSVERGGFDHFFSTHPNAPDRVARAEQEAARIAAPSQTRNRSALLDHIDGMIYGQSPEQGFVMGQRFAHPVLRFEFEYPRGYSIINQASAVVGRAENRILIFDMGQAETAMDPRRYLEQVWSGDVRLRDVQSFRTANGLNAAVGFADVQLQGRPAQGGFIAIQGEDRSFYRFSVFTGRMTQTEANHLRTAADSFRRLTAAQAAELRPQRIRLVTVQPGDTIDSFARRMEVERLPREHFITLNGLDRGRTLTPGEQVKIVVRG